MSCNRLKGNAFNKYNTWKSSTVLAPSTHTYEIYCSWLQEAKLILNWLTLQQILFKHVSGMLLQVLITHWWLLASRPRAALWIVIRDTNCPPPPSTTRSFRRYLGQDASNHPCMINPAEAGRQCSTSLNKIHDKVSQFPIPYITCSQARTSSVSISNSLIAFESFRRNISRTIDSRFQMPSGSRPRRGRNRLCHSAAAGGAVDDR